MGGDEAMTKQDRVFGAVYPNSNFDFAGFEQLLKQNGGRSPTPRSTTPTRRAAGEQAATFVTKLKSKGVTTVVLFATSTMVGRLMKAATDQELPAGVDPDRFGLPRLSPLPARGIRTRRPTPSAPACCRRTSPAPPRPGAWT